MGVSNLLGFVRSAVQKVHISEFRGETLAIDASAWLHRGLFACALEVLTGQSTDRFLDIPLRLVELLEEHGVRPMFVFDGAVLPIKHGVVRRESRALHLERGVELLRSGRETEAKAELSKAASVAPWMATLLIAELRRRGLPFVVAPYEADPQLAFLVREGVCAAAISEDSDLLPYGCPRTLFKLQLESGAADLLALDDLRAAEGVGGEHLFDGTFPGEWDAWRDGLLVDLCVMSGTDYLDSLRGVGIRSAHKALRTHRTIGRALRQPPLRAACKLTESEIEAYVQQARMHARERRPSSSSCMHARGRRPSASSRMHARERRPSASSCMHARE